MERPDETEPGKLEFSPAPKEVDTLPARLGFETTPELEDLRDKVLLALSNPDKEAQKAAWGQYLDVAEPISNDFPDESGRLALTVELALIWRDKGDVQAYLERLIDAHVQAEGLKNHAAADVIYDEISTYYDTPEYRAARDATDY